MKAARQRTVRPSPSPLLRQVSAPPPPAVQAPPQPLAALTLEQPDEGSPSLDDGLAICLFGLSRKMYDIEYEEEMRKQAVMNEVLPDPEMWRIWELTEAPLRKGRGWYPALDRHFLELLVESEILCLANPLNVPNAAPPGQADRIHRHASRVRRVACERIGIERLQAYCDRVREAFEAYMMGGWRGAVHPGGSGTGSDSDEGEEAECGEEGGGSSEGMKEMQVEIDVDDVNVNEAERGRKLEREGSIVRGDKEPKGVKEQEVVEPEDLALDLDEEGVMRIELDDVREEALPNATGEMDIDVDLAVKAPAPAPVEGVKGGSKVRLDSTASAVESGLAGRLAATTWAARRIGAGER